MIIEELKKGDKIYIKLDIFSPRYYIATFDQSLSDEQILISYNKEVFKDGLKDCEKKEFEVVYIKDVCLDDEVMKTISEHFKLTEKIKFFEQELSDLKEAEYNLSKNIK